MCESKQADPFDSQFSKLWSGEVPEIIHRGTMAEARNNCWGEKRQNNPRNKLHHHSPCSCLSPVCPPCIWVYIPGSSCQSDLVQETLRGIWQFENSRHFQQSSPHSSLLTSWRQWRTSLLRPNCLVNLVIPYSCLSFPAASLELKTKTLIGVPMPSYKKWNSPQYFQLPATHITLCWIIMEHRQQAIITGALVTRQASHIGMHRTKCAFFSQDIQIFFIFNLNSIWSF